MPYIKELHIPDVIHIGHLDRDLRDLRPTRDGPAISVSQNPQAWRQITRSNAPEVTLHNSTGLWVDALAFTPQCMEEIRRWGVFNRYIDAGPVWHAVRIDPETDLGVETLHDSYEAALAVAGRQDAIMRDSGYFLSPKAMKRLGRWHDRLEWYGGLLILYTREVIIPKRPLICGIWWNEVEDLENGIAPSGQLLPEGLRNFYIEDDMGDMIPFEERYPGFTAPGAKPTLLFWE